MSPSLAPVLALLLFAQAPVAVPARAVQHPVSTAAAAGPAATPTPVGPVAIPEPTEKALRYHRTGNVVWLVDVALGLLIPAIFLFTGFSARLRDLAARVGRRWFPTLVVYFLLFTLVTWVIGLPWAYYTEFARQHAYGLSTQTLRSGSPTGSRASPWASWWARSSCGSRSCC